MGKKAFGGQHHLVPSTLERLGQNAFRLAARIGVGGVDEVDPGLKRGMGEPHALVVIGIAHRAEHHGAEAEMADLYAAAAQRAIFHVGSSAAAQTWGTMASMSLRSSADSCHSAATALARTWAGLVAPAMTEATHGWAASHEKASSSRLCPCPSAKV